MTADYVGNIQTGVWNPEIHINVANKTQIAIVEDLKNNSVVSIKSDILHKHGPHSHPTKPSQTVEQTTGSGATFAIDNYAGTHNIDGLIGYLPTSMPGFSA